MRRTIFDHTPDGLRQRLADMERQIADLQKVRNPPATYVEPSGGGGTIPFLVAAADAPDEWKAVAAYQCDQTDDAPTIQAAIDAVNSFFMGITVALTPGSYYMPNAGCTLGNGESIIGDGHGTLIYGPDGGAAITGGGRSRIEGIRFSYYNTGVGAVGVQTADFDEVLGCWFDDGDVGVDLASSIGARVARCEFASLGTAGITDTNSLRSTIEGCRFNGGTNIDLNGGSGLITGNHFVTGDVQIDGDECLVSNNRFASTATMTFGAGSAASAFVSNYMLTGASNYTDNGTGTQKPTNGNFSSGGLW